MTAFSHISSLHASRPQLYRARLAAEQAGDRAAQNALETLLDRAVWPLAISGLVCAATLPAAFAMVACTSITRSKKEIAL